MFAVIADGSHQYRVEQGDTLAIAFREGAEPGETVSFDRVLVANGGGTSTIGRPHIEGARVEAEIVSPEIKDRKLEIQRFRRRKNLRRHTGHRQRYTQVRITNISVPGLEIVESPQDQNDPASARKAK